MRGFVISFTAGGCSGGSISSGMAIADRRRVNKVARMKKQETKKGKTASPDSLAKGGKKGGAELSEAQLKNVSGGIKTNANAIIKLKID